MANSLDKRVIPEDLRELLEQDSLYIKKSKKLVERIGRFVDGLIEGDFVYDRKTDMEFSDLEELVTMYYKMRQQMRVPDNIGLLDTKTYKDPNDPRNPHIIEKIKAFGLLRDNGRATEEQKNEYRRNYMEWIRNILLIDQITAEKIGEVAIEGRANKYVHRAIHHIHKIGENFEDLLDDDARSSYYSAIYNEKNSIHKLLEMVRDHLFAYKKLHRIEGPTPRERREKSNHNKALYEISRIFAFASMYIDIEHTPGRGTYIGDKVFLVSKILELMGNTQEPNMKEIVDNDNPFFEYTETNPVFWVRNEDGGYTYFEEPFSIGKGKYKTQKAKFERLSLTGKIGFKKQETIKVLHVDFRSEKTKESGSEKILRKGLTSPRELLDTRGFRFVVETKEEADKLFSLLAHELSSGPETAWAEKPKLQKNESSGENFKCYKGTLKVFHKRGHMQEFIEHAKDSIEDPIVRDRVEYLFSDQQGRILETEIQIFIGKDSYIAAHHDKQSPAYHTNYKAQQLLDVLALLYPPAVFPETYNNIISHLVEKKTEKALDSIAENISSEQSPPLPFLQSPETSPDSHS